ncbi:hypothetical protein [Evansella tamaricis]|uniref:Uncharacterized protein n=1 Tax=Evansella tamaricis TaxID=2069301 RepID=A0ABS6JKD0_9BACI|nr:hypothetical protein [Evansella tamaricis]MBU9714117.1 hypothetical protein [Evansella tamaricis]
MKVKERHFPYPVLADFTDDFVQGSYETDISYNIESTKIVLTIKHSLNNIGLLDLINNGDANYITHIECPKTQFRLLESSTQETQELILDASKIDNGIEVCTFIVATKKIENYTNMDFDNDFEGYSFTLNKGDILAVGYDFNISIDKEELNKSESIIQFEKSEDDAKPFTIFFESNRLIVKLNGKNYSLYNSIIEYNELLPILYSLIGVPVISSALQVIGSELNDEEGSIDDGYSDCRWFKVLVEKIKEKNKDPYDPQIYDELEVILLAQEILEDPLSKSLDTLINIYDEVTEEEEV